MVYEYLLQFTDDPYVKETLRFLMTREIAHFQMFEAALATIQPNFPPGVLQGDPRYGNLYFNMSGGNDYQGPWNQGESTQLRENFQFIDDPVKHVADTNGLIDHVPDGTERTEEMVQELNNKLSMKRSDEINAACRIGEQQWNDPEAEKAFEVNYNAGEIIPRQGEDVNITAEEAQEKGINLDTDN